MRDPHVVALHYKLETGPQLAFNDPVPLEKETDAFSLRLTNAQLCVEMTNHFATDGEARNAVDPYLRSWEIATALERGPNAIKFYFENSKMIDREPPLPGENRGTLAQQLDAVAVTSAGIVHKVALTHYPDPPQGFVASPDVVTMWGRYEGYMAGREPLPSMAYLCLTVLEASTGRKKGKRPAAAARYKVHIDVLNTLGTLTSERGDATTARKVVPGHVFQPLSDAETRWVKEVITALIRRVGEYAADPNAQWPQITMEDFSERLTRGRLDDMAAVPSG